MEPLLPSIWDWIPPISVIFVLLAMAGYFTAIVRAPITGIILIFEMTGQVSQMLSMSLISITAYLVASWVKSEPIYESLLNSLLRRTGPEGNGKNGGENFAGICGLL